MPEPTVQGSTPAAPGGTPAGGGGTPAGGSTDGQSIPYARFKEVNDELRGYKDLGFSPSELTEAMVALAAFVESAQAQASSQSDANAGANGGTNGQGGRGNGQWTQKQWEEWAFRTFPWMREMKTAHDS